VHLPPPQIRNFGYLTSVSRHWCTGVVFMQPGVKVNGAYCTDAVISKAVTGSVTFQLQLLSCNWKPAQRGLSKNVSHEWQ